MRIRPVEGNAKIFKKINVRKSDVIDCALFTSITLKVSRYIIMDTVVDLLWFKLFEAYGFFFKKVGSRFAPILYPT